MTAAPQTTPHCSVCGTPVAADAARCPSCGLSRPAARGSRVLGRQGLWMLAAAFFAVYLVVLLIVAAAR
jgi:predicted nucleic acid-binding Zn ribbon protein